MTWKRFFIACSLCVFASMAFAAPAITVMGGRPTQSSNPIRVWNVAVAPDLDIDPTGAALALELGFRATGGNILSIASNPNPPIPPNPDGTPQPGGGPVEFLNPGNVIFGWEALTQLDSGMFPVGLQVGSGPDANEAFAAVGTKVFTMPRRYDLLRIATDASVTSLAWGGRYNVDGSLAAVDAFVSGRIAQGEMAEDSVNYHGYSGSQGFPGAIPFFIGEMNGDGNRNFGDLAGFGQAILQPQAYAANFPHLDRVGRCDANGDGQCNFGDLAPFGRVFQPMPFGAAAGLETSAVPEPSSGVLTGLIVVALSTLRRRSFAVARLGYGHA